MTAPVLRLGERRVQTAHVRLRCAGAWVADVVLDEVADVTGLATLTIGDLELRGTVDPVPRSDALAAAADGGVRDEAETLRALDSLVSDGLVVEFEGVYRLP